MPYSSNELLTALGRHPRLRMNTHLLVLVALLAPALVISLGLFVGPLIQSAVTSAQGVDGAWSFANYAYILQSSGYRADMLFTLAIGFATVACATLIALPLALVLRTPFRGRQALWLLALLPLVTPHIIAAAALRMTLSSTSPLLFWLPQNGANGINLVNAWPGLLIATTWKFFPVLLLPLAAALQGLPSSYEAAARDLGAGWWRRLRTILLPLILPAWLGGATLVFLLSVSQFTITLVIYGGQKLTTIPVDVYFETFALQRPARAAALGLVLTILTLLTVVGSTWWGRRTTRHWASAGLSGLGARDEPTSVAGSAALRLVPVLALIGMTLFVLGPVLCLVLYSFSDQWIGGSPLPSRLTLRWYDYFFRYENGLPAIGQSTVIAVATATLTTLLAIPAAYALARRTFRGRAAVEAFFLAKTATPIIVLAIGIAALFYRWQINDTFIGIVLAHTMLALPLAIRSITAAFERFDQAQEDAAQDLGATPWYRFQTIVLPLTLGGIASSAALSFLVSMDEFTITFLISGVRYTTLPLRLYSALDQGYIEPAAAAAVLLLIPATIYLVLLLRVIGPERLRGEVAAG